MNPRTLIPLLADAFESYSPESFKAHVRSLFVKRGAGGAKRGTKKKPKPYVVSRTKKGGFVLKVNRKPKWLSREEVDQIALENNIPLNEIWLRVLKKKVKEPIRISTQAEEDARIAASPTGVILRSAEEESHG